MWTAAADSATATATSTPCTQRLSVTASQPRPPLPDTRGCDINLLAEVPSKAEPELEPVEDSSSPLAQSSTMIVDSLQDKMT
jgi:hypothetical protein